MRVGLNGGLEWPAALLEFERRGGWESVVPCEVLPGRYLDWFEQRKAACVAVAAQLARFGIGGG